MPITMGILPGQRRWTFLRNTTSPMQGMVVAQGRMWRTDVYKQAGGTLIPDFLTYEATSIEVLYALAQWDAQV